MQDLVDKYGFNLFLFMSRRSLQDFIDASPAPDDDQWARALTHCAPAARNRVLAHINGIRKESILAKMASTTPEDDGRELLHEFFPYPGMMEFTFGPTPTDDMERTYGSPTGNQARLLSELPEAPAGLHSGAIEDLLLYWLLLSLLAKRHGVVALEPALDSDMDAVSRGLLELALSRPDESTFSARVREAKNTFLDAERLCLRAFEAALSTLCSGSAPDELQRLLAAALNMPAEALTPEPDCEPCIDDGELSVETARSLLLLVNLASEAGILRVEGFIPTIGSDLFSQGLRLVTEGLEPETLARWFAVRRDLRLGQAEQRFNVIATACWCILTSQHRNIARELLQACTPIEITEEDLRALQQALEETALPPKSGDPLSPAGRDIGRIEFETGDASFANPLYWLRLKTALWRLARDQNPLLGSLEFLARLALSAPACRWSELREQDLLPEYDAAGVLHAGFRLAKDERLPASCFLNLAQNVGVPDADSDALEQREGLRLATLENLAYWDALLLPPDEFAALLARLSAPQRNALAHSAFGQHARELGLPLFQIPGRQARGGDARHALLAALAVDVLPLPWECGRDGAAPEPLEASGLDLPEFAPESPPAVHLVASLSLEDGLELFRRLPVEILAALLDRARGAASTAPEATERIAALASSLPREMRRRLRHLATAPRSGQTTGVDDALAFGFEEFEEVPDELIRAWLKNVSNEELTAGLVLVPRPLRNKILGNLSHRAAEMILEDMEIMRPGLSDEEALLARHRLVLSMLRAQGPDPDADEDEDAPFDVDWDDILR